MSVVQSPRIDANSYCLQTPSICPGRHFAKDNAFLTIATVLHVFDILPAIDQNGNEMDPTPKMTGTGGLWLVDGSQTLAFRILIQMPKNDFSYPDRLNYMLKPRSQSSEALIRATAVAA